MLPKPTNANQHYLKKSSLILSRHVPIHFPSLLNPAEVEPVMWWLLLLSLEYAALDSTEKVSPLPPVPSRA